MPVIFATAPAKTILFGEHAVVYQHPAIATPVESLKTKAIIMANPSSKANKVIIHAPNIGLRETLDQLPCNHPLSVIVHELMALLKINHIPSCEIKITSTIPVASGLGSSASTAIAIIRALSSFLGFQLSNEMVNNLAFQGEKIQHGNPSGIDNTVITYQMPIYFIHGQEPVFIKINQPLYLLIGDTGIRSLTKEVVANVRNRWSVNQKEYEALFEEIGSIAKAAKNAIEIGNRILIGELMIQNHKFLQTLDVSCPELDQLVLAAMKAGALGAKLCGGGRGGNMLALVNYDDIQNVKEQLLSAGAVRVVHTIVKES